jgi:predicted nucleotidyltransferase
MPNWTSQKPPRTHYSWLFTFSLIEKSSGAPAQLCVRYRVRRLELIGSAVTGEKVDAEKSDIVFLVEVQPLKEGECANTYFGLLESLELLFNRHVDLVMVRAVKNPYFLESIDKSRKALYAA